MAVINSDKGKEEHFEEMAALLLRMALLCAIYFNDRNIKFATFDESISIPDLMPDDEQWELIQKIFKDAIEDSIKEMNNFFNKKPKNWSDFLKDWIEILPDVADRDNLISLSKINLCFSKIYRKLPREDKLKIDFRLWKLEQSIVLQSGRALGYWSAKINEYERTVKGSDTRIKKTERKINEMLELCKEYNIYSASDLKKNKSKRQEFMTKAKAKLDIFSDRRILEYLKNIEQQKEDIIS